VGCFKVMAEYSAVVWRYAV